VSVDAPPATEPLLEARNLELRYPVRTGSIRQPTRYVRAVDDVSLELAPGETLGVVGESGCGKSSLARCLVRLATPTAGTLVYRGRDITRASTRSLRPVRREIQMVFQDPEASLNGRKRVGQILATGLRLRGVPANRIKGEIRELLRLVGLNPEQVDHFPHEFSGGQRQRIGIARALSADPRLVVLDEPVSALDVSIRAQVVNLLADLREERNLSYVFVAHDLAVVRHASDRIAVMYLGRIVEQSPADDLYDHPLHPYTAALLAAVPMPDRAAARLRSKTVIRGEPANALELPSGCRFRPRCPRATELCATVDPQLVDHGGGHLVACHHPLDKPAPAADADSCVPA
jgi:peptide/nickel transport system ATP-binding protein